MNRKSVLVVAAFVLAAACSNPPEPQQAPLPRAASAAPAPTPQAATTAAAPEAPAALPASGVVQPDQMLGLSQQAQGPLLLDVRSPEEHASGHVPGARNIPVGDLPARLAEVEPDRQRGVITDCEAGGRASQALETLKAAGFAN